MRTALVFFLGPLLGFGSLHAGCPTDQNGIVFGEPAGKKLQLDLRYPKTPPPAAGYPLLVSIHGGGWMMGGRTKDFFLRNFTDDGYAVASIDYRLSSTTRFPAQIEDCRLALRWLIDHAAEYRINPRRIGVTGASAGGHLALLLGLAASHRFSAGGTPPIPEGTIKAVCAFYPPTDLVGIIPPAYRRRNDNPVAKLLGGSIESQSALAREGSPVNYTRPDAPATLLVHGDRDSVVPLNQSEALVTALQAAGAESRLIIYTGAGHAFGPRPETRADILAFFNRHLRP